MNCKYTIFFNFRYFFIDFFCTFLHLIICIPTYLLSRDSFSLLYNFCANIANDTARFSCFIIIP